jgi:hypothetical protein
MAPVSAERYLDWFTASMAPTRSPLSRTRAASIRRSRAARTAVPSSAMLRWVTG